VVGVWRTEAIGTSEDDGRGGRGDIFSAGLGDDAFEKVDGRFRPRRFQHLHPRGSTLGVGEHGGASGATGQMKVKGGLVSGRECAVERVQEHRFTLRAVCSVAALGGFYAAELVEVCHLHHLSF